jgi:hypothetical protein
MVVVVAVLILRAEVAEAGCGDVGVGRIDWTEVTLDGAAKPKEARLHGAFAWEGSEAWQTHPISGTLLGFVHVACDGTVADCSDRIAQLVAVAGTKSLVYFTGRFYGLERPPQVFPEGGVSTAITAPYDFPSLTGNPNNPQLGETALALPLNEEKVPPTTDPPATDPPATDPPATDPPATDPPAADPKERTPSTDDDSGCQLSAGRPVSAVGALVLLGLAFVTLRARRRA